MIHDSAIETMEREALRSLQLERLRDLVRRVHERVPFYVERLDAVGVDASSIRTLDDLRHLPLTRKEDMRDHYPFGLLAVPRAELARVHASSGTTGKPTVVGYTVRDLEAFGEVNARCLAMAGAEPGMMLHNAYGYGLFTGGLGLHAGAERLGMAVVPASGGMTERQLTLIADFRPDVIACTPSYGLTLAEALRARGVGPEENSLSHAIVGAEPWTEAMRGQLDRGLGVASSNLYGLSEVIGPGVSAECVGVRSGSHVNEDHFLPEVVDPASGEPLADGEEGVLVFTTLTKEALPLIRYWSGDLASLSSEPCECGRTLVRMSLVKGRTDDMLIVRGVNIYPSQVEAVLGEVPELSPHYRLLVDRQGTLDELTVEVEVSAAYARSREGEQSPGGTHGADPASPELRARISQLIKGTIGCTVTVELVAPGRVPRSEGGKLARVVDRRALPGSDGA